MTNEKIAQDLKRRLNEEGAAFGLHYEVSKNARSEGDWTQFYVRSDETRQNRAASRQIMADVEEDVIKQAGREIILIPVSELLNAA